MSIEPLSTEYQDPSDILFTVTDSVFEVIIEFERYEIVVKISGSEIIQHINQQSKSWISEKPLKNFRT